jgi:hypothetical protein
VTADPGTGRATAIERIAVTSAMIDEWAQDGGGAS